MNYGARLYAPEFGRFLTVDPLLPRVGNSQVRNRYAYTLNNPLKYTDPSGRQEWLYHQEREAEWFMQIGYEARVAAEALGSSKKNLYEECDGDGDGLPDLTGSNGGSGGRRRSRSQARTATLQKEQVGNPSKQRDSRSASDNPKRESGQRQAPKKGVIYEVPGRDPVTGKKLTRSGKPYVGSADDLKARTRSGRNDGRLREHAKVIDEYDLNNPAERRVKEQFHMDQRGGKGRLDNRRNEIAPKNRSKYGLD